MAGPILIFGRFATAPCFKRIFAAINCFFSKCGAPFLVFMSDSWVFAVDPIRAIVTRSKVINPVVGFAPINVIDYCGRLLSVMQKPSNSVRKVSFLFEANSNVSSSLRHDSSFCPRGNFWAGFFAPPKVTRIRAIAQHFANFLWNNLASQHDTSSIVLVRGLTVAAVSTPIIPRSVGYANG